MALLPLGVSLHLFQCHYGGSCGYIIPEKPLAWVCVALSVLRPQHLASLLAGGRLFEKRRGKLVVDDGLWLVGELAVDMFKPIWGILMMIQIHVI